MNALWWLELRTRVRERRLWILALFTILVPLIVTVIYLIGKPEWDTYSDPSETGMFLGLFAVFCQAGMLVLLAPLASAQRISQEREQRTYAALINSPLTPAAIVRGKLLGTWSFILWLGMLSLPFMAVAMLWGGCSPGVLLTCFVVNMFMAMMLSTVALGFSGLFGRSLSAYLACGAFLFLWCAAIPIIGIIMEAFFNDLPDALILYLNVYHLPLAPQVWLVVHAAGETDTFQGTWSIWAMLYGLGIWLLLMAAGYAMALRGVKKEVY